MLLMYVLAALFALPSCGSSESQVTEQENKNTIETVTDTVTTIPADSATFYSEVVNKKNCFIVISKPEYRLYVCEVVNGDTPGDMKTPECTVAKPFSITEIVDASKWTHDFGDGRGDILAYGDWFMRLKTPGHTGIGIHGSTNNESSVPGRGSEGCIRLRNDDLNELKAKYAFVGMRVVILADE